MSSNTLSTVAATPCTQCPCNFSAILYTRTHHTCTCSNTRDYLYACVHWDGSAVTQDLPKSTYVQHWLSVANMASRSRSSSLPHAQLNSTKSCIRGSCQDCKSRCLCGRCSPDWTQWICTANQSGLNTASRYRCRDVRTDPHLRTPSRKGSHIQNLRHTV